MSTDNLADKEIDRREFLKKCSKAAALATSAYGLESLIGCAPTLKETKQDTAHIKWDCNPIIPIPKERCYTGTNEQASYKHPGNERWVIDSFRELYGLPLAFHAIGTGTQGAFNDHFPRETCLVAIERGTIPVIRYVTFPVGYREVTEGKFDDHFKRFANQAAEFGRPIVLLPWQGANEPSGRIWVWSGPPPNQFKEAWIRIHSVFQNEGANKNVVWSTKLVSGRWAYETMNDPIKYIPPKEYIDIVGWNCGSDLERAVQSRANLSFDAQFRSDYTRAAKRYPTKPQMLWELGASNVSDQAKWMDDALTKIQTHYPRVKGVMFDVMADLLNRYYPGHTPQTIEVIRKHFASGYFIGSAIKK